MTFSIPTILDGLLLPCSTMERVLYNDYETRIKLACDSLVRKRGTFFAHCLGRQVDSSGCWKTDD
jgi:hypothetical protein